ncbi:MAG: hypothetical protein ABIQ05_02285 [Candidatus Limnocylindria bacterium]
MIALPPSLTGAVQAIFTPPVSPRETDVITGGPGAVGAGVEIGGVEVGGVEVGGVEVGAGTDGCGVSAGRGVAVALGRGVAAGPSLDGAAVGTSEALAIAALAEVSWLVVAPGVPLPARTSWSGVRLACAIPPPGPPRAASISCQPPTPRTVAAIITPTVAPTARPTRTSTPRITGRVGAGTVVAPGSMKSSLSNAAIDARHAEQTEAWTARSRGGLPSAPASSHAWKRAWGSLM